MTDVDDAKNKLNLAQYVCRSIEHERELAINAATQQVRERFAGRLAAADGKMIAAKSEWQAAVEKEAIEANTDMPTHILYEWKKPFGYGGRYSLTGKRGRYELCTRESKFAPNVHYKPEVGERFVRILKKDGSPSLLFVRGTWIWWLPEGESPK